MNYVFFLKYSQTFTCFALSILTEAQGNVDWACAEPYSFLSEPAPPQSTEIFNYNYLV